MLGLTNRVITDVAGSSITYVGKADVSATTSQSNWRIFRITTDINGGLTIDYVNGDASFIYCWDLRSSYTYGRGD